MTCLYLLRSYMFIIIHKQLIINFIAELISSLIFAFLGSASIDLFPKALSPNSILPLKNPNILFLSINSAIFLLKSSLHGRILKLSYCSALSPPLWLYYFLYYWSGACMKVWVTRGHTIIQAPFCSFLFGLLFYQ